MKKSGIISIVGALFILILAQTNPGLEDHRSEFKSHFMEQAGSSIFGNAKKDGGIGNFGSLLGSALVDKMVDLMISRDNYVLFSLTKMKYDAENKIVGVGILGNVFVLNRSNGKLFL